jgi:hypothetical protein
MWRLIASFAVWLTAVVIVYVLSEGPARWLVVKLDLDDDSRTYCVLTVPYRGLDSVFEQMPESIQNMRLDYLDVFVPGWIKGTAIFLD